MKGNFAIFCLSLVTLMYSTAEAETDCSVHPEPVDPLTCCSVPEFFTPEITEKCKELGADHMDDDSRPRPHPHPHPHPHPRPHPHPPHHHPCFASCVFNETGIFDEEQKLNENSLHDYLATVFKDESQELIPIVEEAFKTCVAKGEEMREKWAGYKKEKMATDPEFAERMQRMRCPMGPSFLMGCAFIKTFPKCPTSLWNDNDQCNGLRDFITDCEPKFIGRHGKFGRRSGDKDNKV